MFGMATHHNVEVICLSSDDIPPSSPSGSDLTERQVVANVRYSHAGTNSNGKGKEVRRNWYEWLCQYIEFSLSVLRLVSPGQDLFQDLEAPLQKEITGPTCTAMADHFSSWRGHSQNVSVLETAESSLAAHADN